MQVVERRGLGPAGERRVSRAALLHKAGAAALNQGTEDQRRDAGLAIVEALTRREREPWYVAALPWAPT